MDGINYNQARQDLLTWVREQIIGTEWLPHSVKKPYTETELQISPFNLFASGILFPLDSSHNECESVDEESGDNERKYSDIENRFKLSFTPSSSIGFSFFIPMQNWELELWFSARTYSQQDGRTLTFAENFVGGDEESFIARSAKRQVIFNGKAAIDIKTRSYLSGTIITVSLFNTQDLQQSDSENNNQQAKDWIYERTIKSLFGVQLHCFIRQGEVADYPTAEYSTLSDEEQELALQYRHKKVYAIGHGVSAKWQSENGKVTAVYADFMPVVEVPQVTADTVNQSSVLNLHFLSQFNQNKSQTIQALHQFVEDYAQWITTQKSQLSELGEMSIAGRRIVQRMEIALHRMKSGIQLLAHNENAAIAFSLANQAMLNQMLQSAENSKKNTALSQFNWRPFQLAFILTTLSSSVNQEDDFRDMFDLIWFPTGGGKTEAYLGLAAFVILFRRLAYPNSSDGTAVLMRYTLRLLTAQQFIRATRLICALEILRQQNTRLLGDKPINIGLWVGQASTPNLFSEANDIIREIKQGATQKQNAFVLQECPWCKTPFSAQNFHAKYNTLTKKGEFHFHCYSPHCHFGQSEQALPCQVVDEGLYEAPPTFLVATLDKFARFPWEDRAASFLGKGTNRPPELIIQDELHLIAGALGSVSGIYEAALDTVLRIKGIYPKYVASTATIRMADEQVKKLYAKEVSIFPPQGIDAEDAYFAKTVPLSKRPGRCYVGYFAPHLSRRDSLTPLAAALLRAPSTLFNHAEQREKLMDAWWTQVIYHGSLKGVGVSHNAFNVDVSKTYQHLYEQEITANQKNENYIEPVDRQHPNIKQLTSLLSAADNTEIFARLELNWMKPKECIDVLLATNMISVGLDVGRLALMVINGQPLTTAEYIQASSRVGRSTVPGVVFVNYYRDQARSLSHYENFQAYHDGFYRFVEPTSVTPFTYQARKRALAAALVMVMRHSIPNLLSNSGAERFSSTDEDIANALKQFTQRCGSADPDRKEEIARHILKLAQEWDALIHTCQNKGNIYQQLVYYSSAPEFRNLLTTLDEPRKGHWAILNSMRNVEHTGEIDLL